MRRRLSSYLAGALLLIVTATSAGCADADEPESDAGSNDVGRDVSGDAGAAVGSCTHGSICVDYVGEIWTEALMRDNCSDTPDGIFAPSACPTDNRVGRCVTNAGGPGEFAMNYYSSGLGAETAEALCDASGSTWIPSG